MTRLRTFRSRLLALVHVRRSDRDLDDEIATHLAEAKDEFIQQGLSPEDAHFAALRRFGGVTQTKQVYRQVRSFTWLHDLVRDMRHGLRMLRRSPNFTIVAVLTLALGIGVNIGMFSFVNGLLLRPLYDRPDEVVEVHRHATSPSGDPRGFTYSGYADLMDATPHIFATLGASSTAFAGVDAGDGTRRTLASAVSANYFQIFGQPLTLGRAFTRNEERPGADGRVAIISYPLWQRRGADPGLIGQSIRVNGEAFTVVGVAPKGFSGTSIPGSDVWIPLGAGDTFSPFNTTAGPSSAKREAPPVTVVGRLKDGTSIATAALPLAAAGRQLAQAFPAANATDTLGMTRPPRLLFMSGGGMMTMGLSVILMVLPAIVLLVACLNLVDLLLARGEARRQEMAIRFSLGAGRGRLIRQLAAEGLVLACAGGLIGLLLSTWTTSGLMASVRPVLPVALSLPELDPDWRVFAGTVGFSVAATLILGAWSAWALTRRVAATDLKRQVGDERRGRAAGIIAGMAGNGLVIGQVALSLLLVATGGLFLMSALSAATADPGFRLDAGVLAEVDPGMAGYDEARGRESLLALVDRLRSLPGVEAATMGSSFPFNGFGDSRDVAPTGLVDAKARAVGSVFTVVGRDYVRTLGLPMLAGRDFTDAELAPGAPERVAIVDEVLAKSLWPGEGAIGQDIQFLDGEDAAKAQPIRVVGLVPSVNHSLGNPHPFPHVYVPFGQHYESAMTLQLRIADKDAAPAMLATVGRTIRSVDVRVPILRLETWRDHLSGGLEVWLLRSGARVTTVTAGIALLLAVIGVYGVKSYAVSRRTREFGIRIAIGAHPRAVLWQVLREGGRVTLIGLAIGVLLAVGAGQLLRGLLYGLDAVEPVVLATAALILVASSLLASLVPALRATKVDPTVALRTE